MLFYIIGMPGAGKHRLGRELAAALELELLDVGAEVRRRTGSSPAELVERLGERKLSELDAECMLSLARGAKSAVVATTGFAPLDERSRELMKRGKTIYLYRSPEQLWEDAPSSGWSAVSGRSFSFFSGLFEEYEDLFIKCADLLVYGDGFGADALRDAKTFCRNALVLEEEIKL